MSKKQYSLEIKGKTSRWSFVVLVDPQYVDEWRADGLEIAELYNTVPAWVAELGLTRFWRFCQDVFYWKNPFKR